MHRLYKDDKAGPAQRNEGGPGSPGRGIPATLESIRRQIEEGSGKVDPPSPPPGAEPPTDENPAVVDVEPPDVPHR